MSTHHLLGASGGRSPEPPGSGGRQGHSSPHRHGECRHPSAARPSRRKDRGADRGSLRTWGHYDTCHVVVRTPRGAFTVRAGIVPNLPVPLLIGRDCPIFHRLWNTEPGPRPPRPQPRGRRPPVRHAYGARAPHSSPDEISGEGDVTGRDSPSPPGTPGCPTGETPHLDSPGTPDTLTASEQPASLRETESSPLTELSDFPPTKRGSDRPGQFATAQLQDDTLKHAWSHVIAHDGHARDSVSTLPHQHFCTRSGLLYRVTERGSNNRAVGGATPLYQYGPLHGPHACPRGTPRHGQD